MYFCIPLAQTPCILVMPLFGRRDLRKLRVQFIYFAVVLPFRYDFLLILKDWFQNLCSRRILMSYTIIFCGARGGVVVKALRYKPAGRGFDSRWCHWNFSVSLSFRSQYGPGVDSASNRNEYQVYFLGGKAAGA